MKYLNKINLVPQKLISTFFLVLIFSGVALSQVSSNFAFSQSVTAYTPITGATILSAATNQDAATYNVTGLSFPFLGSTISQVVVSTDGYIALGVGSFTNSTQPIASGNAASGIIASLAMNLVSSSVSGAASTLSWVNNGTETIFQWEDFARSGSASTERFSFQLRINNTTGVINLVYGSFTVNSTTNFTPQVGIRGTTTNDYFARRLTTSVPDSSPSWDDTVLATSSSHNVRFTTVSPAAFPDAGRTYTFTPIYCVPAATASGTYINNFSTAGGTTNISNLLSGFTVGGYQNNYATQNATIAQGGSLTTSFTMVGGSAGVTIWVDLNNNQTFETSEKLYNAGTFLSDGTYNVPIAIPVNTPVGEYHMRILTDFNASNPIPCTFNTGLRGEAEDYKVTVIAQPTDAMDYANLQFPPTANIPPGGSATVYTQGYEPGVTPPAGPGAGINVSIGVNTSNSDPSTWATDVWMPASFNVQVGNNDEFQAVIGSSLSAGTYYYASRWQLNGGPYVYGGYNVGGGGFWNGTSNVSGVLTVNPPANDNCSTATAFPIIPNDGNCVTLSNQSTAGATNSNVTPTGSCSSNSGTPNDDIWFSFVAPTASVILTYTFVSGQNDIYTQVFSGSCGATMTSVLCTDSDAGGTITGLTIGNTYYIRMYTYYTLGPTVQNICLKTPPPPPACVNPTSLTATSITSSSAILNWTENGQGTTWDIELATAPYIFFGVPTVTGVTKPYLISTLMGSTGYQFRVRASTCSSNWSNSSSIFTTLGTPPANDEASAAIPLVVGSGCTGAIYNNNNATTGVNEPNNCQGAPFKTVWFSFVAPASGAVRVSNDEITGSLGDSRIAIHSASNVNNYTTFTVISCDEDNGSLNNLRSIAYATGLQAGSTYYVSVGTYDGSSATGTFCVTVDELNSGMIASSGSCESMQSPFGSNALYTGFVSFTNSSGQLVALVKNPTGVTATSYVNEAITVNSGPVRSDANGKFYLDRNFRITNPTIGPYNVVFFFLNSELAALTAADPATTLANLKVTRTTGESSCNPNYVTGSNPSNGLLAQTNNGSVGGVSWIGFNTPGFSQFFVSRGNTPLPVNILSFNAKALNNKAVNLSWKVADELDVKEYTVERSNDNRTWSAIGSVSATQKSTYDFNDNSPLSGVNYYRLAVKDLHASLAFSEIRTVNFSGRGNMALYPNPANNVLFVSGTDDKNVVVSIYNEVGQIVSTLSSNGENIRTGGIDVSKLIPGAYSIQVKGESGLTTMRFVKQ